ncbi:P-loop NTPase fold protein [Acinetobacter sp. BSP-28]|uniref:KAP family P-loop NTPase fold protein n=1 Tax=Acinetobacter sp. BSP-28 TaxID=3344661 RepID=UPI0037705E6B
MHETNQLNWQRDNFENIETAWEGDLWDRQRLGIQLTNYVDRLQCGAVLALDARWGEGKTWFVRHWAKHLDHTNHNVIYLDAFANDYLDDPFLVISSEITGCLSKDDDFDQIHINTFKEKAAAAYQALLPSLPKVLLTLGLNLISGGVLGAFAKQVSETGKEVIESATDELGDKIKESIEAKIENHEADKNTLLAFKQELAQLAEELDKPLVFIIDELDRCRPDFAIRLIERIKHFFDISKIVFVLVMNKPQLLQSVKNYYGYDSDLNGDYFEKFIDYTIEFPKIGEDQLYEGVIKEQLYRIGEITSKDNQSELFFWILSFQAVKKYNSRELVKKINQYALLRTDNIKLNLILSALIFDENFEISVGHLNKIINHLFNYFKGVDNTNMTKAYFVEQKIFQKLNVKQSVICETYENISRIETGFTTQGQQSQKKRALQHLLIHYCIGKLDDIKDFKPIWKQYIKTGLFEKY